MQILYNIAIYMMKALISIGSLFNDKLRLGVVGRKETFKKLQQTITTTDHVFWFHCASLGEFEQGLPIFAALKKANPHHKVVLSFFSPSGYEIKKHSSIADVVVYLPLDSPTNAHLFLDLIHPNLIVFVKYEIWINYLLEIKKRHYRAILISALFRENQLYFKWYGGLFRKAFMAFEHIFVQDVQSQILLEQINLHNTMIAGDTRFDRVLQNKSSVKSIEYINEFINNQICIIIGSSWPEDEAILCDYINRTNHPVKFIIVPHNVNALHINQIKRQLNVKTTVYTTLNSTDLTNSKVLIINTIGMLSHLYHYAQIAYVGGAMGKTGLHNILEPAVFGIPVVIGKNFKNFPEAKAMISNGGVISISDFKSLDCELNKLISNAEFRNYIGSKNTNFITLNAGVVDKIMTKISL